MGLLGIGRALRQTGKAGTAIYCRGHSSKFRGTTASNKSSHGNCRSAVGQIRSLMIVSSVVISKQLLDNAYLPDVLFLT